MRVVCNKIVCKVEIINIIKIQKKIDFFALFKSKIAVYWIQRIGDFTCVSYV